MFECVGQNESKLAHTHSTWHSGTVCSQSICVRDGRRGGTATSGTSDGTAWRASSPPSSVATEAVSYTIVTTSTGFIAESSARAALATLERDWPTTVSCVRDLLWQCRHSPGRLAPVAESDSISCPRAKTLTPIPGEGDSGVNDTSRGHSKVGRVPRGCCL